jgi:putative ABC transport system substrate-binding protein
MRLLRTTLAAMALVLLAAPPAGQAQPSGKIHRIGLLRVGAPPPTFIEPFRQGLREMGYVEGHSVIIDQGLAGSVAKLPETAAELLQRRVDVLVASGTPSVVPAKNATKTVPVVFVAAIDPVATGIVATLARPGGNITGVSAVFADAVGKRLQLVRELLPRAAKVALLVHATSPATPQYLKEVGEAARAAGLQVQVLSVRDPADLDGALASAQGASALLQVDDAMLTANRARIADLALKHRLPSISGLSETVAAGGLMSYGPHYGELYRQAAKQVVKILRGASPATLPVEQPTRFELVINLKTATALGLVVPPSILARADEVLQ